jgi:UPF0755 protein
MKTYYHHKQGVINKSKVSGLESGSSSKKFLMLSLLIGLSLVLASYFWYKTSLQPVGPGPSKSFIVQEGDSVNEIMDRLKKEGLVKSSLSLKIHAKINGTYSNLKVGNYSISPELSGPQIVEIISGGKVSDARLTILAGKTIKELLPELNQHFGQDQVTQTLDELTADFHPILVDQAGARVINLEGYLLPETYTDLNSGVTFENWLKRNFDLFEERIAPYRANIEARGFTLKEAFTLASIVQQESSVPEEQKKIAQVFELRLERDISLGADPTFIYAAKLKGVQPTVDIDSPYNTRIYKGLPPTPIGTFELSALEAVANPSQTDYLFFVAGDDGTIYYSRTNEEHEANTRRYCIENCSLF